MKAPVPHNEQSRLEYLGLLDILDTPPEDVFDRITSIVAAVVDVPIALISLVDEKRQWFKSHYGLDASETSRDLAFCSHAILGNDTFVVEDAAKDERFSDNPLVTDDPSIRFYAGAVLRTRDGFNLGTLCAIDRQPKALSAKQKFVLEQLAELVVYEMTSRMHLQHLLSAKEEAESKEEKRVKYVDTMSHEVKTPLNAIIGFTELMASDAAEPMSAKQREALEHVNQAGTHLQKLMSDAFDLSAIESKRVELTLSDVNFLELALEVKSILAFDSAKFGVDIDLTGAQDYTSAHSDYTKLKQVVLNIASNAIKYSGRGRTVKIASRNVSDTSIRVSISDDGPGIPEEQRDSLFEPFNRLGAEYTDVEGTGIGLTISKGLVEVLGGQIIVESEEGKGTSVHIDLPSSRRQVAPAEEKPPTSSGQRPYLVLYIEDNPVNHYLMEMIIGRIPKSQIVIAKNALEGISKAEEIRPDIILMDKRMPGMSGLEAVKVLRDRPEGAEIPIIAISGDTSEKAIKEGLEAGFNAYLPKPLQIDKLMTMISAYKAEYEDVSAG